MSSSLGVGVIGVNPDRGWARESHVPAVRGLRGLELVAVASRRQDSAERAAAEFGATHGYGNPMDLITDPAVDVVGVAASVPAHRELILAALDAGKHVYSEWPLGIDTDDAEVIAKAAAVAAERGVHTAIGVQARTHPAVITAARLLQQGAVGRPLSATALSTTAGFGPTVADGEFYLEDPATGMHLVTIQLVHTLDVVSRVLGPFDELAARLSIQFPELAVGESGRHERRTLPDHALIQAGVGGGVPLDVEVAGGRPPAETPFRLDVVGERGTLSLVGGAPRGFQTGPLELLVDGRRQPIDDAELAGLPTSAVNVACVYAAVRDDVADGGRRAPDFDHGRRLSHLVDDIRAAAAQGPRLAGTQWPQD